MNALQFETKQDIDPRFFVWKRWLRMVNRHPEQLRSGDAVKRTTDNSKFQPMPTKTK